MKKIRGIEDRAMQCGQFLVDYLNAETYNEAYRGLEKNVVEAFDFSIPVRGKVKDRPVPANQHPYIDESSTKLKELFSDIKRGINLDESEAFDFYVYCYEKERSVRIDVQDDDSIIERPLFEERNDEVPRLYAILAYCMITALKSERMRRLICKCENPECLKYYIPERDKKKKGGHRFCCDACRSREYYLRKKQPKADKKKQK